MVWIKFYLEWKLSGLENRSHCSSSYIMKDRQVNLMEVNVFCVLSKAEYKPVWNSSPSTNGCMWLFADRLFADQRQLLFGPTILEVLDRSLSSTGSAELKFKGDWATEVVVNICCVWKERRMQLLRVHSHVQYSVFMKYFYFTYRVISNIHRSELGCLSRSVAGVPRRITWFLPFECIPLLCQSGFRERLCEGRLGL